jgi:hypothetical protein
VSAVVTSSLFSQKVRLAASEVIGGHPHRQPGNRDIQIKICNKLGHSDWIRAQKAVSISDKNTADSERSIHVGTKTF